MMKRFCVRLAAVVLAAAFVVCFGACAKKGPQTVFKPSGESKGELILGFDSEYPPYGYLDTEANEYAGFDIEYAKAVCTYLGYTLTLVPIDWNSKDLELESGNINCIWSGFTINGREDLYEWSVPYVDNSIVVLTAADAGIAALSDLAGKTVTVQAGSSGQSALDSEENAALVASFTDGAYRTCADYTSAFQELKAGAVDAVIIDVGVAKYFTAENEGFAILDETVSSEQYGVGFLKGNTELCTIVSDAMLAVAQSGDTVSKLAETYDIADSVIIGK